MILRHLNGYPCICWMCGTVLTTINWYLCDQRNIQQVCRKCRIDNAAAYQPKQQINNPKQPFNKKAYYESHKEERKAYYEANKDRIKAYYERTRDPNSNRMGSKEHSINLSCALRHIDIKDFNGFTNKSRPYITPVNDCIKMNALFKGSHAHHITKSIIIYIPKELHQHINHNLRTGHNMGEINIAAIQYVNGGLDI